jgi:hypothetical protein
VLEHRGELLSAALTVLRSYVVAGRPDMELSAFGSFDDWSRLVRGALRYAGLADPMGTRAELRDAPNPEQEALATLFEALATLEGGVKGRKGVGFTAKEILHYAVMSTYPQITIIRDALEVLCPTFKPGETPTAGALGTKLATNKGRLAGGYKLVRGKKLNSGYLWRAVKVEQAAPNSEQKTTVQAVQPVQVSPAVENESKSIGDGSTYVANKIMPLYLGGETPAQPAQPAQCTDFSRHLSGGMDLPRLKAALAGVIVRDLLGESA